MQAEKNRRYIGLDGRKNLVISANALAASASSTGWICVKSIDQIPQDTIKFPLAEVTIDQIKELRKSEIPSFLLKENESYYFAKIPKGLNLLSSHLLGRHCCSNASHTCGRLSSATDEEGGCAKVRNFSKGIERYPWITAGYETFNCRHPAFVVAKCDHFEVALPHAPLSAKEKNEASLLLAQFVWEDVDCWNDVIKRMEKNFNDLYQNSH